MSKAVLFHDFFPHSQSLLPLHTPQRSFVPPPALSLTPPMLAFLALLSLPALPLAAAQGDLSAANNVTDLEGTWSSNSAVSTGGVSRSPPSWHS